jgi:hypothetical protein
MSTCRRLAVVAVPLAAASSLALAAGGASYSPPASTAAADELALKFARRMRRRALRTV